MLAPHVRGGAVALDQVYAGRHVRGDALPQLLRQSMTRRGHLHAAGPSDAKLGGRLEHHTTKPAAEFDTHFDALNATAKPATESYADLTADPSSDNMQPRDV